MKISVVGLCLAGATLFLTACGPQAPITTPPVAVVPNGNPVLRGVIGFEPTELRSRKDRKEVSGAQCDIQGVGFTAKATTPALINLPDQKSNSQPVTATCTLNGETRTIVSEPYSKTSANNTSSATANAGLLGAAFSGIIEGVRDQTNDDWGYTSMTVRFDTP